MIYLVRYIKFLWQSKNAHGVHSPFVYNLVVKCLLDFSIKPGYKVIDAALAQHKYSLSKKHARLLFRVIHYLKPDEVLYEGEGNMGLFTIISGQGQYYNSKIANSKLQTSNPKILTQNPQHKTFYFIDTNDKAAILTNFRKLLTTKNNNTTLLFNDIHASEQMQQAWHTIKNHPDVTVSIDTFYFGLIFFRKEQANEHFAIRITNSGLLNAALGMRKLWGLLD